jgi:erythromycin esterase
MRKVIFLTIAFSFLGLVRPVCAQNFEKPFLNGSPATWYAGSMGGDSGKAYKGSLDSVVTHSGKQSLCLQSVGVPVGREYGIVFTMISADSIRGKTLTLSMWLRTKDVTDSIILGGNDGTRMGNFVTVPGGTNDWRRYSFNLKIDSNSKYIDLGIGLKGQGAAWVDDVQIQIDGKDYVPDSNAYHSFYNKSGPKISLTSDQLQWLRANVSLLTTTDPTASLSDLAPIKDIVGNSQIVGLGEATHGTREFFQMKHRIVEYLAQNMGFTIFAIEANMPEAYRLNDYVLHGIGDPTELINGMYFWTWNTEEVLDMVKWMREFNLSGKGRIEFLGFDMQYMTNAAANVQWFLDHHDTSISHSTKTTYALARELILRMKTDYASYYSSRSKNRADLDSSDWLLSINDCKALEEHLGSYSNNFSKGIDSDTLAWALQNARIVTEAVEENYGSGRGHYIRDSCMAWNVKWIRDHNPGAKIVLWAHDGHIQKDSGSMGYYLDRLYGSDYVAIGFSFYDGTYTATGKQGLTAYTAAIPDSGTIEYNFHKLGIPIWLLDIRKSKLTDPVSDWLHQPVPFRTIGAMEENYFPAQTLSKSFDALIYIDHSNASHLLPSSKY